MKFQQLFAIKKDDDIGCTDFILYPRKFVTYRWWKPLLVAILLVLFTGVSTIILGIDVIAISAISGSDPQSLVDEFDKAMDNWEIYDAVGAIAIGLNALYIPAIALAAFIVKDRPFSAYTSCMGGWRMKTFLKCIAPAFIIYGIGITVLVLTENNQFNNKFTVPGFILLTVLCPLQCIGEEYLFRGLLMPAIGSWCRLPAIAILLQTLIFAPLHSYDLLGKLEIAVAGILMGLAAWYGRGIEASSAMHIANNIMTFYYVGLGMTEISEKGSIFEITAALIMGTVYIISIVVLDRKYHWFDERLNDDVSEWNVKASKRQEKGTDVVEF